MAHGEKADNAGWSNPNVRRLAGWLTFAACILGMHAMDMHLVVLPGSQWDFETYYYAYHVHKNDGDPYDLRALTALAGRPLAGPWVYPPHTFRFFELFAERPLTAERATESGDPWLSAKQLFLGAKLACLAAVILIWTIVFVSPGARGWFLAFITLGLNAAIGRDLMAGNVSVFEQLLIWIGVAALLGRAPSIFCLCIVLASQFKLMQAGLLALLWFVPWGRRWRLVILCVVLIAINVALVGWFDRQAAANWLHAAAAFVHSDQRVGNPGALSVMRLVTSWVWRLFPQIERMSGLPIAPALYASFAATTLLVTFRRMPLIQEPRTRLYLGIVTFALVVPRLRDYSWCLVLLPCFELARLWLSKPTTPAWVLVLLLLALTLPGLDDLARYRPFLAAWLIWAVTLYQSSAGSTSTRFSASEQARTSEPAPPTRAAR